MRRRKELLPLPCEELHEGWGSSACGALAEGDWSSNSSTTVTTESTTAAAEGETTASSPSLSLMEPVAAY